MPRKFLTITGACATLAIAGYALFAGMAPPPATPAQQDRTAPALDVGTAPRFSGRANNVQSGDSPFSGAAANDTTRAQQRYEARGNRMAQGGYGTPAEYYYLPLAKLQELASRGDIYALLQLGQQYWDEPDAIASEAGFDASAAPSKLAVEYLSRAVMAGATQPALTLATRLATSDPAESYAWALFAEKLQITGATEMASRLRTRLSDRDIGAALVSADEKLNQMTQATTDAAWTVTRAP